MNIVERARRFAVIAHANQQRKYNLGPYVEHPFSVAQILSAIADNVTEAMLCAAYLHDIVEDTHATLNDVEMFFGKEIKNLVYWLTDISTKADGNRASRKEKDRLHIAQAPAEAKSIKLADLIDNSSSIVVLDPDFAKVYMDEKRLLLPLLKDGDPKLYKEAERILNNYYK